MSEQQPWKMKPLDEWSIVGMNHYHQDGQQRLFVAMTKDGKAIVDYGTKRSTRGGKDVGK
jgi:hypothetical protein